MIYVISDIHGCYDQYKRILKKINFTDNDVLYVLGDVVDRGPEPMKVLRDMSMRANVIPVLGNHDAIAHSMLSSLLLELNEENLQKRFDGELENFARDVQAWQSDGGTTTLEGFGRLSMEDREAVIEYLSEFSLYEKIKVNGITYILTHAGLPEEATPDNLDSYDTFDFITANTDYGKQYFLDVFLITGHLPTFAIDPECRGRIYRKHNHIAIDTGAVFGGGDGLCLLGYGRGVLCVREWRLDNMVYLTGDTHRDFERIEEFCIDADTTPEDVLVILGDVGINYLGEPDDRELKETLAELPVTLLCVHGNHEMRPESIETYEETEWNGGVVYQEPEFPNLLFAKDGEIYELEGRRCIAIGGAYSVDKYHRRTGIDWWPDEQPSDEIKDRVERRLATERWRVDAVFSHTCPMKHIPREAFLPFIHQASVDNSTEEWLDEIEDRLEYGRWYCGHYHTDKNDGFVRFLFEEYVELA